MIPAVNFHLIKACNMKCRYCFAMFNNNKNGKLILNQMKDIIYKLHKYGFDKINFVGGEPLLYKHIVELIKYSKNLGFYTSVVTNGSHLTEDFLSKTQNYIDMIGISIDSLNKETNKKIGRITRSGKAFDYESYKELCYLVKNYNIQLKVNTVVSKYNLYEDFNKFIFEVNPVRWKVFQVLGVEGENDITDSKISKKEFEQFIERHKFHSCLVAEDNNLMQGSYVMIDPEGRFFDNSTGKYTISEPILKVGVKKALQQVNVNPEKFLKRKGDFYKKIIYNYEK